MGTPVKFIRKMRQLLLPTWPDTFGQQNIAQALLRNQGAQQGLDGYLRSAPKGYPRMASRVSLEAPAMAQELESSSVNWSQFVGEQRSVCCRCGVGPGGTTPLESPRNSDVSHPGEAQGFNAYPESRRAESLALVPGRPISRVLQRDCHANLGDVGSWHF
jgi:hypothetical protein